MLHQSVEFESKSRSRPHSRMNPAECWTFRSEAVKVAQARKKQSGLPVETWWLRPTRKRQMQLRDFETGSPMHRLVDVAVAVMVNQRAKRRKSNRVFIFFEMQTGLGAKLAHTDKQVRDRAVKHLSSYLHASTLSTLSLRKLCKGLFYWYFPLFLISSFWMSDKQHVQLHLAETLSRLLMSLPLQQATAYNDAWWWILSREWAGIDRIRLNKYYMFMRKMYSQV